MDALQTFFDLEYQEPYPNTCNKNEETPIHIAARSKKASTVKSLLDAGADANALDSHGNTPLHSAVNAKSVAAVKILLRHSATDLNARTPEGDTPLILASRYMKKKQQLLVDLVKAGADVNAADSTGKTALHWAAECKYAGKLDLLLKYGANKMAQDKQCRTPLHLAAIRNGAKVVKRLLEVGAEVNAPDIDGRTPLHLAAAVTAVAAVQVLLRHSATDLNARATNGDTPLLYASSRAFSASRKQQLLLVDLINAGADVNAKNRKGYTALYWATKLESITLMEALLQNGVNVNAQTAHGRTPLHEVTDENVCKKLLDAGADANIQDNDGYTSLHLTVEEDDVSVFRTLLHRTTNLNSVTNKGSTPLTTAAYMGLVHMVIDLINAGANVNAAGVRGKTALHWAADFTDLSEYDLEEYYYDFDTRKARIARYLLDSGADANAKDDLGNTPLHITVLTEAPTVFDVLLCHCATDLNAQRTSDGKTALILMLGSERTLENYPLKEHGFENLIIAGADMTVMECRGWTVLHVAANWNDTEAMEVLLKHGADVNLVNKAGKTALHICVESDAWAVFEVLLKHPETDLNARRPSDRKTPLIMMIESEMADIEDFEDLVGAGVDLNATDNEGKTALHYAAKSGYTAEIDALFEFGANPDIQDRNGQTPLHLAASAGSFRSCRFLVAEFFANRDIADNRGRLPQDLAMEMHHDDIVVLLNDFMPAG